MISAKFVEMAKKLGVSPETISWIEKDLSSKSEPKAAVTVVKVSKIKPDEQLKKVTDCCDYTDEEIDKMSEDELKKCLKECRDCCKQEEESEWADTEDSWEMMWGKEMTDASKKEMNMQDIFNKIG